MKVSVELTAPVRRSFRVEQVTGLFDVALGERSVRRFEVGVPDVDEESGGWRIGAIIGPSGSGKSTIARQAYGRHYVTGFEWSPRRAVVDDFPAELDLKTITQTLAAVGFSTPPAWVLPYHVLSTGQRFRCDLARALLRSGPVVAFDEFTSTVDRQVGRFASACVARTVRGERCRVKRFVAVTCHSDVLDWLQPDWVLDLSRKQLARGCLCPRVRPWSRARPRIVVEVRRITRGGVLWPVFAPHHYLSTRLHPNATCYGGFWEDRPVVFCALIPNVGWTNRRLIHRLVVLPDFQGLGLGTSVLNAVAEVESSSPRRPIVSIRTSHPSLIGALRRSTAWRLSGSCQGGTFHSGFTRKEGRPIGCRNRSCLSFTYRPEPRKS